MHRNGMNDIQKVYMQLISSADHTRGYEILLCYVLPNGHTTGQPDLTAYTATALHHTRQKYH